MLDAWLPVGFELSSLSHVGLTIAEGDGWQICALAEGGRALLANAELVGRWTRKGLFAEGAVMPVAFGGRDIAAIDGGAEHTLARLSDCQSPRSKAEAMAFASAMKASRLLDAKSSFNGGIYLERFSRILPLANAGEQPDDALVLGTWMTGGVRVSAVPIERLQSFLTWLSPGALRDVIGAAGLAVLDAGGRALEAGDMPVRIGTPDGSASAQPEGRFRLPGRPQLEAFFNEHIVDLVQHPEQYKALGIGHPGAVILEGPPGCGKSYAVDKLVEFLNWPCFTIDSSSVASPYIHETGRKVNALFRQAIEAAPSVVVIDEMEAFLSERDAAGSGHHRVEEVAEFLRRIPEAVASGVLVLAMTNRIDMIDPAIRRRGRFDHLVKVDLAGELEVRELLASLLANVPTASGVDLQSLAKSLSGRPLSDIAYVVREGARLAAKERKSELDQASLSAALASSPSREQASETRRIGFVWQPPS